VIGKVDDWEFAGIETDPGTVSIAGLLLTNVNVVGTFWISAYDTVPVADEPTLFDSSSLNAGCAGATIAIMACFIDVPPAGAKRPEAEITLQPDLLFDTTVIGNVPVLDPGGINTAGGTVTSAVIVLVSVADNPVDGAFPFRVSVPVALPPGEAFAGTEKDDIDGGRIEKVVVTKCVGEPGPGLSLTWTTRGTGFV